MDGNNWRDPVRMQIFLDLWRVHGMGGMLRPFLSVWPVILLCSITLVALAQPGLVERPGNPSCHAPSPVDSADPKVDRVFPSLCFRNPALALQSPGDTRYWYLVELGSRVQRFENDSGVARPDVVLNIRDRIARDIKCGLIGVAFHPKFALNGEIFPSYMGPGPTDAFPFASYVSRFSTTDGGTSDISRTGRMGHSVHTESNRVPIRGSRRAMKCALRQRIVRESWLGFRLRIRSHFPGGEGPLPSVNRGAAIGLGTIFLSIAVTLGRQAHCRVGRLPVTSPAECQRGIACRESVGPRNTETQRYARQGYTHV